MIRKPNIKTIDLNTTRIQKIRQETLKQIKERLTKVHNLIQRTNNVYEKLKYINTPINGMEPSDRDYKEK